MTLEYPILEFVTQESTFSSASVFSYFIVFSLADCSLPESDIFSQTLLRSGTLLISTLGAFDGTNIPSVALEQGLLKLLTRGPPALWPLVYSSLS